MNRLSYDVDQQNIKLKKKHFKKVSCNISQGWNGKGLFVLIDASISATLLETASYHFSRWE